VDVRKIQQLLDGNGHDFALPDDCGLVTTIFWGISRPLTKSQNNLYETGKFAKKPYFVQFCRRSKRAAPRAKKARNVGIRAHL